jgi:polyphosphate kinase 2 (PPK2 family)
MTTSNKQSYQRAAFRYHDDFDNMGQCEPSGIIALKFFLHLSKEKQREQLPERIILPEKQWKFSSSDIEERDYWDGYMHAYEEAISSTSTARAPWHIIPAEHRRFSALAVAGIVVARFKALDLSYPEPDGEQRQAIERARRRLERE